MQISPIWAVSSRKYSAPEDRRAFRPVQRQDSCHDRDELTRVLQYVHFVMQTNNKKRHEGMNVLVLHNKIMKEQFTQQVEYKSNL
jgi:hypothetical protein